MELFLDTANLDEIKAILPWGVISGLTTNQKIFLAEKGCNFEDRVKSILALIDGPVSVEVTSGSLSGLVEEAKNFSRWGKKIVVKIPMFGNGDGLKATAILRREGIKTNMTALMNPGQALLAAKCGATYASLFFNRIKDAGRDPNQVIRDARVLIDAAHSTTKIIVGSIRKPEDVFHAALAGAHIVTVPYKIMLQMPFDSKTEETIAEFDRAWKEFTSASAQST